MDAIASQRFAHHQIAYAMFTFHMDVALSSIVDAEQTVFSIEDDTFMCKKRCHLSIERQVFRCAETQSIVLVEQPKLIGGLQGKVYVMCRKEDGFAGFARDAVQELHHLHLAREVKKCRRLIEEDDRRLLSKRFSDHHLLSLAIAQRLYHA